MRRNLGWVVLLLFGFGLAQEQFDIYRFSIPQGWERRDQSGLAFLVPKGLQSGEAALIALSPSQELQGEFGAWFEGRIRSLHQNQSVLGSSPTQSSRADGGYAVLASSAIVRDGNGVTQYRFYMAGNPGKRVVLLMYSTNSLQLFSRYESDFLTFARSINLGEALAAAPTNSAPNPQPQPQQPTQQPQPQPQSPPTAGLPSIPVPTYADVLRLQLNPKRQPMPDEFRCYERRKGDDYSRPSLVIQFLQGGQYRSTLGNGAYTTRADGSLSYVVWRSGPLAGSDEASILFNDYGQRLWLSDVGREELDYFCYQRGAREQVAQIEFRFKDPQVGSYPCVQTDGSNAPAGTLEILQGRRYRLNGAEGRYTVDILGKQREDYGDVDFSGGPLDDRGAFYSEDTTGQRRFSFYGRGRMDCKVTVAPTRLPRFGTAKAPAPPAGSGGLEGAYVKWNIDPLATTTPTCGGLCWDLYIFNKNGYVYTDEPEEDLEEADCTRTKPNGFPICEVYRVQGNQIVIGNGRPVAFQRTAEGIEIGGDKLTRMEGVDGLKLTGRYRAFSAFSTTAGGSGGGFSEVIFSFTPDGRFTREGAGGFFFNSTDTGTPSGTTTAGVSTNNQRTNSGTYRFVGNTLELKLADGRTLRLFAFVGGRERGTNKPNLLRIGGRDYSLQEK